MNIGFGIDMERVRMTYYEGGHMMYLNGTELVKLTQDIRDFLSGN
jgi:carboxypeptidase C (cathepsin A)